MSSNVSSSFVSCAVLVKPSCDVVHAILSRQETGPDLLVDVIKPPYLTTERLKRTSPLLHDQRESPKNVSYAPLPSDDRHGAKKVIAIITVVVKTSSHTLSTVTLENDRRCYKARSQQGGFRG